MRGLRGRAPHGHVRRVRGRLGTPSPAARRAAEQGLRKKDVSRDSRGLGDGPDLPMRVAGSVMSAVVANRDDMGRIAAAVWGAIALAGAIATIGPLEIPGSDTTQMRDLAGLAALFAGISFVLPWARLPRVAFSIGLVLMSAVIAGLAHASGSADSVLTILFTFVVALGASFMPVRSSVAQLGGHRGAADRPRARGGPVGHGPCRGVQGRAAARHADHAVRTRAAHARDARPGRARDAGARQPALPRDPARDAPVRRGARHRAVQGGPPRATAVGRAARGGRLGRRDARVASAATRSPRSRARSSSGSGSRTAWATWEACGSP